MIRDREWLVVVSLAASIWFALWFFLVFPAVVLHVCGAGLVPPPGASRWIGGAVASLALAGVAIQVAAFVRVGRGTHAPFAPPERLVTNALYARCRNPMYLLYVTVAVGEAIAWRSPSLAGYAFALFALIHVYVTRVEEPALARRFGDAWSDYARRVPRYLPARSGAP